MERPLIIAHRGASLEAPENTLAAFRAARARSADGVELDVMRCASGEVVVFHDHDLERLAGRPERIRALPLAALREVRIGGQPIPTLGEALEELGDDLLVNIELKSLGGPTALRDDGLTSAVAGLVRRHALGRRVLVSSFNPVYMLRFRALAPEIPTGLLFHRKQARPLRDAWIARWLCPMALHAEDALAAPERIEAWRRRGHLVAVWTVDRPERIAALARAGVDAIITNDPAGAFAALPA